MLNEEHQPIKQFEGPIAALFIYIHYRDHLHKHLNQQHKSIFADNNTVIENILHLLYNQDFKKLNEDIIKLISPQDRTILQNALNLMHNPDFSSSLKLASIDYMNNFLGTQQNFIAEVLITIKTINKENNERIMEIMIEEFDANIKNIQKRINLPETEIAKTKLGIDILSEELPNQRNNNYGTYNHYDTYHGDIYRDNRSNYSAYSNTDSAPYENHPYGAYTSKTRTFNQEDVITILKNYIQSSYSRGGISGWKYCDGKHLPEDKVKLLATEVVRHFNTEDLIRGGVVTLMLSNHGRTLDDQITASATKLIKAKQIDKRSFFCRVNNNP